MGKTFQELFDRYWDTAKQVVVTPKGKHWRADVAGSGQEESTALVRQGPRTNVYHDVDLPTVEDVTDFAITAVRCRHDKVVFIVYLGAGGIVRDAGVFVKSGSRLTKHTPSSYPRRSFDQLRRAAGRRVAKSNVRVESAVRTIDGGTPPKGAWGLSLVFEDVTSHKFYSFSGKGRGLVTIGWGRVNTQGQSQVVEYDEAVKRMRAKIRKGYKPVAGGLRAIKGPLSGPIRLVEMTA